MHLRTSASVAMLALLAVTSIAGCPQSEKPSDKKEDKKEEAKGDKKTDKKADDGDDKAPPKAEKPKADEPVADEKIERTKMPTVAEWNAATDVNATGNDVGCEVRTVREWLRVSCRKKSPGGGDATAVYVLHGKTKDTFLFSIKGVASMVTPFLPGTDLEARYSWSDVVYRVEVRWKKGKAKPSTFAIFEKTDEAPTAAIGAKTCECFKKVNKKTACTQGDEAWDMTSTNPWCETSYPDDCEKLNACAHGEPGAMVKCPKGFHIAGLGHACLQTCDKGEKCPAGTACIDGDLAAQGSKVCDVKE